MLRVTENTIRNKTQKKGVRLYRGSRGNKK
jgi:hypothetical protein